MKTYLLLLSVLFNVGLSAQMNCEGVDYEVSTFIDDYINLDEEDLISLTNGLVWDDPEFDIPIGFEFSFYNQTTSDLAIVGDLLGGGVIGNPVGIKNSINAMLPAFADYTDLSYADGLTEGQEGGSSHISYITEGDEGNRIFKLEWRNVGFYYEVSNGQSNNYMNVQLWLYEEDDAIEFRYGDYNIEDPELVFEGLQSPVSGLVCSLVLDTGDAVGMILDGDQADPFQADIEDSEGFTTMPDVNRVYRLEKTSVVGINESNEEVSIIAFPVPFIDELTVSSINGLDHIQMIDLTGKIVFESFNEHEELTIDTSMLPSSIYFLRAEKDGKNLTYKVVK